MMRRSFALLLAGVLAAGCEETFRPFEENDAAFFSLYGYLDLNADTQWVRVMPVRQSLFLSPDPIDAVVTLERVGSGRVVTLRDSLFTYPDDRLGGVGYAHNFWTTEPLEPGATYRLQATRSDGNSTTATVPMPENPDFLFRNEAPFAGNAFARTGRLLYVDVQYLLRDACAGADVLNAVRQRPRLANGSFPVRVDSVTLACHADRFRHEVQAVIARPDWPFPPDLPDLDVAVPGRVPSGVENGVGFVGGVAIWTVPFEICTALAPRPDRPRTCEVSYTATSASISGRVVRPCGTPLALRPIRLVEEFARGGAILRTWRTGLDGGYRFDGLEPGSRLTVELEPGIPALRPPPLRAGERHAADVTAPVAC